ncbi:hypothetical protein BFG60_4908 [Microcystis aeruginosa NIES-98]|nr:hypothetical protein BFG60_4908 [Microcystis aeruginosa NIES-98]
MSSCNPAEIALCRISDNFLLNGVWGINFNYIYYFATIIIQFFN